MGKIGCWKIGRFRDVARDWIRVVYTCLDFAGGVDGFVGREIGARELNGCLLYLTSSRCRFLGKNVYVSGQRAEDCSRREGVSEFQSRK